MNNLQVRRFYQNLEHIPCPLTERLISGGFRQKSGGYIRYARQCGVENPSQYWHLMTSWSDRSAPGAPFDRRIRCGELIFWMAEASQAVPAAELRKLADCILREYCGRRRAANRLIQEVCFARIADAVESALMTPFGPLLLLADGCVLRGTAVPLPADARRFPDLAGRFRVEAALSPDGRAHTISAVLPGLPADAHSCRESGEGFEAVSFSGAGGIRLTLALAATVGRVGNLYDYDCKYEENGLTCLVLPETETEVFPFGIAWAEGAPMPDTDNPLAVQTWLAADPTAAS
ncbi:MAG: hypothetical protein K6E36_01955 [Oscillospiraceae bacterium]|nr:hypothetical protein [Oscillospiraceae bacterium]MCR5305252.1 hypothetical protein [Oscillospiraceae bacterium]